MSGSTILESRMAIHKLKQELEKQKDDPEYAKACNKIYPIVEKYKNLADRIKICAMLGGVVVGGIAGVATYYLLKDYMPNGIHYSGNPLIDFTGLGAIIGEITGGVASLFNSSRLEKKAKKEIDTLGLEYTIDESRIFF